MNNMLIEVWPRFTLIQEVEAGRMNGAFVLSIHAVNEPGPPVSLFDEAGIHSAVFRFADTEAENGEPPTLELAARMRKAIEQGLRVALERGSRVAFHCHMGVSRSAAAGLWAGAHYGLPVDLPAEAGNGAYANRDLARLLAS